jgi:hypothetical protein
MQSVVENRVINHLHLSELDAYPVLLDRLPNQET